MRATSESSNQAAIALRCLLQHGLIRLNESTAGADASVALLNIRFTATRVIRPYVNAYCTCLYNSYRILTERFFFFCFSKQLENHKQDATK